VDDFIGTSILQHLRNTVQNTVNYAVLIPSENGTAVPL